MNPARMKTPSAPSTAPAEPAPAPVSTPAPAGPVAAVPAPHKTEAAPIEAPAPIEAAPVVMTGALDPVALSVLAEIPDRPRKAERIEAAPIEAAPIEATSKKRGPLLVLGGVATAGLLALVLRAVRPGAATSAATGAGAGDIPAPVPVLNERGPARGVTV